MDGARADERIAYIDGLRAVAVVSVVLSHIVAPLGPLGQSFGVELFFVISGFCLAYPTLRKLALTGAASFDIARYAARRVVRIVPPYFAAIAVGLAFIHFGVSPETPPGGTLTAGDVIRQALFLDRDTPLVTLPFWSLPVEFRWYFFFPIVLWLWTRSPRAFGFAVVAAVLAANATRAYSVDLFVLPAFMSGIAAAQLSIDKPRFAKFAVFAVPVFLALAFAKTGTSASVLWQMAVFALVVAAGSFSLLRYVLSTRLITAVGVASYSIYLVHKPIMDFARLHGVRVPWQFALALAGGFAFWWIVERPLMKGALRDRMVAEFETFLPRWFATVGIARSLMLEARRPEAIIAQTQALPNESLGPDNARLTVVP
jgi:peptidoglycan/LPS O-acetylase OafA/YrhL